HHRRRAVVAVAPAGRRHPRRGRRGQPLPTPLATVAVQTGRPFRPGEDQAVAGRRTPTRREGEHLPPAVAVVLRGAARHLPRSSRTGAKPPPPVGTPGRAAAATAPPPPAAAPPPPATRPARHNSSLCRRPTSVPGASASGSGATSTCSRSSVATTRPPSP